MNLKCKLSIILILVLMTIILPLTVTLTMHKFGASGSFADSTLRLFHDYNQRSAWAMDKYGEDNPRVMTATPVTPTRLTTTGATPAATSVKPRVI